MNEMIERVAKAIYYRGCPDDKPFEDIPEVFKAGWFRIAKAAIKAMKEPTEAMLDAGAYDLDMTLKQQWKLMIEAALK